jgi:hypothetical protein
MHVLQDRSDLTRRRERRIGSDSFSPRRAKRVFISLAACAFTACLQSREPAGLSGAETASASSALSLATAITSCDFDGDHRCDFSEWRPSIGTWAVLRSTNGTSVAQQWGMAEDIPVAGDYDGDGKADFATWRPSSGNWAVLRSRDGAVVSQQWGAAEDVPVPGDYDGDGKTDFATWRPSSGNWAVRRSRDGVVVSQLWGAAQDIPVPGDYDGDGTTDFAAWRPSTGTWAVLRSSNGTGTSQQWGSAEDIPVAGDYDGDGKTDFATWRPSTGNWAVLRSRDGAVVSQQWGMAEDVPVPGDYDGDGKVDFATRRPSSGFFAVMRSTNGSVLTQLWGTFEDVPISQITSQVLMRRRKADYDGDARTDIATWRPSTGNWAITRSSDAAVVSAQWGMPGDAPVLGDFDGDGKFDTAIWRPASGIWAITNSSNGSVTTPQWGATEDIPVPGDYDGDRKSDLAVWRPSTGNWAITNSSSGSQTVSQWGAPDDLPVPNDYDGDGKTDLATWRPSTGNWAIINSSNGGVTSKQWGATGDIPVPGDYDGDGKADLATWHPSTGNWAIIYSAGGATVSTQWGAIDDVPVPGDYDGDGKTDLATWRPATGNWAVINSSNGGVTSKQWGASEDIPVPLGIPVWPWFYRAPAPSSVPAPTLRFTDAVTAQSGFWEFSSAVAPPGTGHCLANGRRFSSGSNSSGAVLFQADATCQGSNCTSNIFSRISLPVSGDSAESDNVMTRLSNGTILLVRGLLRKTPILRSGTGVWASSDCGDSWTLRSFIDPSDTSRYPPPEFPADPNANYGSNQRGNGVSSPGGWDREETYADPFAGNLYIAMSGNGGLPDGGADGAKYQDMLLFRSTDGGSSFRSTPVTNAWVPGMMTAVPRRLFFFTCSAGYPFLWWSDDNGVSINAGTRLSWGLRCAANQWGVDGSEAIARVRWTTPASGPADSVLRVIYPSLLADGRQVLNLFNVSVSAAGAVAPQFVQQISASGADVVQATLIEPDPAIAGVGTTNASLIYWKELSRAGVTPQSARARGVLVKDDFGFSPFFNVSTTTPTGTTARTWPNTVKTGDYAKGSFYFASAASEFRYVVNWLEVNSSGGTELHTKTYAIPR